MKLEESGNTRKRRGVAVYGWAELAQTSEAGGSERSSFVSFCDSFWLRVPFRSCVTKSGQSLQPYRRYQPSCRLLLMSTILTGDYSARGVVGRLVDDLWVRAGALNLQESQKFPHECWQVKIGPACDQGPINDHLLVDIVGSGCLQVRCNDLEGGHSSTVRQAEFGD